MVWDSAGLCTRDNQRGGIRDRGGNRDPAIALLLDHRACGAVEAVAIEAGLDPADIIAMGMLLCPHPAWVKAWPSLEMLVINAAYEEAYGIEVASYVGQSDQAIWGADTAAHFHEADKAAFESGGGVTRQETFANPRTGAMETTTTTKWPVRINDEVVAIAGIITVRKVAGGLAPAAPEEK